MHFYVPAVQVNHIGECLEGVEGYADRQGKRRNRQIRAEYGIDVLEEEPRIFENSKAGQRDDNGKHEIQLFLRLMSAMLVNGKSRQPDEDARHDHKDDPERFTPGIKKERECEQHVILGSRLRCEMREDQTQRQKCVEEYET